MTNSSRAGAAGKLGILLAAVGLGLTGCGGGAAALTELEVGDCIRFVAVSETSDDAETVGFEVVDCDAEGFRMQVSSINPQDGCPNSDYVQYGSLDYSVCVAPVLEVGSCYVPDDVAEWALAECGTEDVWFKIEKELTGTDTTECTDEDGHFILPEPEPGRVFCTIPGNTE